MSNINDGHLRSLWVAALLGLSISPNLQQKAEEEVEAKRNDNGNGKRKSQRQRHNDPEIAAKFRAEREARKRANYTKRKGKP